MVTRILLWDGESFKDEVNLLILNASIDFVLPKNRFDEHFICSEFSGVFLLIHICMTTILQVLKFWFLHLVITFFVSLAPIIVMASGDYCVNV